jgi:hypothetical protein
VPQPSPSDKVVTSDALFSERVASNQRSHRATGCAVLL